MCGNGMLPLYFFGNGAYGLEQGLMVTHDLLSSVGDSTVDALSLIHPTLSPVL